PDGREVARGLVNYDAQEVRKIVGLQSDRIAERLGHCPYEELVHRDQMTPAP
ncbi:MAG: PUA domain-containing protein, partial [Pirellulaceae bacterium]